jgi:hypothetical protein
MGVEGCRTDAGLWEVCASDYLTTWQVAPPNGAAAKRCVGGGVVDALATNVA